MSLVMRGAGVGDGVGDGEAEGEGVGLGVCASEVNDKCEAVRPATPRAGSVFTNSLRSQSVFDFCFRVRAFMRFSSLWDHCACSDTLRTCLAVFQFQHLRSSKPVDGYDIQIVEFTFRNDRQVFAT